MKNAPTVERLSHARPHGDMSRIVQVETKSRGVSCSRFLPPKRGTRRQVPVPFPEGTAIHDRFSGCVARGRHQPFRGPSHLALHFTRRRHSRRQEPTFLCSTSSSFANTDTKSTSTPTRNLHLSVALPVGKTPLLHVARTRMRANADIYRCDAPAVVSLARKGKAALPCHRLS